MKKTLCMLPFTFLVATFANAEMSAAIGHNVATYRWGKTAAEADRAALQACKKPCAIAMTTSKACIAGAYPDENGYQVHLAAGETEQEARTAAILKCESAVGSSCHARGYGCRSENGSGTTYVDGW